MTIDWNLVLTNIGGTAAIVTAMAWLGRKFISQRFDKDLESYKSNLRLAADKEMASLTTSLTTLAEQAQTRHTILHEKRAEVLAMSYAYVDQLFKAAVDLFAIMEFSGGPTKKEKYQKLAAIGNDLKKYFDEHRIFLTHASCDKFDALFEAIRDPAHKFFVVLGMSETYGDQSGKIAEMKRKEWTEGWQKLQKEVPTLKSALEDEFRFVLGVTEASDDTTPN